jgi:hypothetical protein
MEYRKHEGKTNNKKQRHKNPPFSEDQVIITESDTILERSVHKLYNITSKYEIIIHYKKLNYNNVIQSKRSHQKRKSNL